MSDRDELARDLQDAFMRHVSRNGFESDTYGHMADVLLAAGWRKKPSREEIAKALEQSDPEGGSLPDEGECEFSFWYDQADAILALLDGPTETGEVVSDVC